MKLLVVLVALIGCAAADVSQLSSAYLPPAAGPSQEYLPPVGPPQQTYIPPPIAPPQQNYLPPQSAPPPLPQYIPPQPPAPEYLPPSFDAPPAHDLGRDGYRYRTARKFRLRRH